MPARARKPKRAPAPPKFARAVYTLVRRVPRGRVVTYGQVAAILGTPRRASAPPSPTSGAPQAHRPLAAGAVNAAGGISARGDVLRPDLQRELLEIEGVAMRGGRIDLGRFRWSGPSREWRVSLSVELPLSEGRFRHAGRRRGVKSTPR
jgi:methylated-DNA-protein-cysteine methyltransferase-like protein